MPLVMKEVKEHDQTATYIRVPSNEHCTQSLDEQKKELEDCVDAINHELKRGRDFLDYVKDVIHKSRETT